MIGAPSLFDEVPAQISPIILRPYQGACVDAVLAARDRGLQRVLVIQPTGTGKTTVFSELTGRFHEDNARSLVVAHRDELLDQAAQRISLQNPTLRVGIEGGDNRAPNGCDAVVAGVQSIGREGCKRLAWLDPKLMVIDEAHHAPAPSYQAAMKNAGVYDGKCFCVGVTATPHRMDNHPLHGDNECAIFEEVVYEYSLLEAMRDNYLCDIKGFRVSTDIDLSQIKTTGGDYNQKQLSAAVNTGPRNRAALRHWAETCQDRRTIAFCAGVDHAKQVAEVFRDAGIRAEHVDGGMKSQEREAIIRRFRTGETQVLSNVDICTEGFDAPECSCVLLLRPTKSWALYTQMVGRGLRLADGKPDCIVLDVVDNTARHNIASVPALLGLPADMDLQGNSLRAAANKFGSLDAMTQAALFKKPSTFDSLSTKITAIDMLGQMAIPDHLRSVARLSWLTLGEGRYLLSLGDHCRVELCTDAIGDWHGVLTRPNTTAVIWSSGTDDRFAIQEAEDLVYDLFPDAGRFSARARWKTDQPTEKQIAFLVRCKVPQEEINAMTRGDASNYITMKIEGRRKSA